MELPAVFEKYRAALDGELRRAVAGRESQLYDMLRYHLGWIDQSGRPLEGGVGKALRPTLCLLACEAGGSPFEKALPSAAALELVHNFSLIHDDIQDDDTERRHRPTVWAIWGKPQAINAGSAMHVVAILTMFQEAQRGVSMDKVARAIRLLEENCLRLIEGQYLDIGYEDRLDVGVADYLKMIEGKTGALIACSLELGALIGTDDERVIQGLRQFGAELGLAFQIRDDELGIWGDSRKTGKPIGADILRRKKSLPIVYALENATGPVRDRLAQIYRGETIGPDELAAVMRILADVGAQAVCRSLTIQYHDKALAELERVPLPDSVRRELISVSDFLARRDF